MSETVTVEIPLDLAKKFLIPGTHSDVYAVRGLVEKALPPEYPDGQIARVVREVRGETFLATWDGTHWVRTAYDADRDKWNARFRPDQIASVELLQVAGKDEIVVPRPPTNAAILCVAADILREKNFWESARFLRDVADRM